MLVTFGVESRLEQLQLEQIWFALGQGPGHFFSMLASTELFMMWNCSIGK